MRNYFSDLVVFIVTRLVITRSMTSIVFAMSQLQRYTPARLRLWLLRSRSTFEWDFGASGCFWAETGAVLRRDILPVENYYGKHNSRPTPDAKDFNTMFASKYTWWVLTLTILPMLANLLMCSGYSKKRSGLNENGGSGQLPQLLLLVLLSSKFHVIFVHQSQTWSR